METSFPSICTQNAKRPLMQRRMMIWNTDGALGISRMGAPTTTDRFRQSSALTT